MEDAITLSILLGLQKSNAGKTPWDSEETKMEVTIWRREAKLSFTFQDN